MTLDLDKLVADLAEFSTVMGRLGIPCQVRFNVRGVPIEVREVPGPVQVPLDPQPVTPEKKAAAAPSPAPKKKKDGRQCTPGMLIKCPHCERSMDRRSLHGHISHGHKDLYKKEEVTRYIRGDPSAAAAAVLSGSPGPAAPAEEITKTMHVKTTRLYEGISTDMIGVVQKRSGKYAEVNFGKLGYRDIPVDCLEAV
jgi:hypothetical protein